MIENWFHSNGRRTIGRMYVVNITGIVRRIGDEHGGRTTDVGVVITTMSHEERSDAQQSSEEL
ncbi:hypothetical protein A2U01_0096408 [Trifolium medium]|uniref:Uncharacterized protein n=1 Tax=Trifolium medium TaxID=97028 RepID=A0A392UNI8_9FABA|nr:hypothetical protein [Trifolium medium]